MKSTDWRNVMGKYVSIKKYIIFIIFWCHFRNNSFFGMVVHKKQYRWKIENPEG